MAMNIQAFNLISSSPQHTHQKITEAAHDAGECSGHDHGSGYHQYDFGGQDTVEALPRAADLPDGFDFPPPHADGKHEYEYSRGYRGRADGDARRFTLIEQQYAKAPRVTRERLYLEAMEQVFSSTTKVFIDQKAGNNLLYLPLDKLVPRARDNDSDADAGAAGQANDSAPQTSRRQDSRKDLRSRRTP